MGSQVDIAADMTISRIAASEQHRIARARNKANRLRGDVALGDGPERRSNTCASDYDARLDAALRKMKSASAIISELIRERRDRRDDPERVEQLYTAKGALTCAIEDTENEISRHDY